MKRQLIMAGLFLTVAILAVVVVWRVAPGVLGDRGAGDQPETVSVAPSPSQTAPDGSSASAAPNAPVISAEIEAFLQEVELLIHLSRDGLDGIVQATAPSDPAPGASDAIQYVIDNRTEVRQRLSRLTVPDDYQARSCRGAFKKAMTYALDADYHYLDWANGHGGKGAATPDSLATIDWKTQFVDIYNSLAAAYGNGMRHDWQPTDF